MAAVRRSPAYHSECRREKTKCIDHMFRNATTFVGDASYMLTNVLSDGKI